MMRPTSIRFALRCLFRGWILLLPASLAAQNSLTTNEIEDAIRQLSADNVRGYVQPFINGFGANLNSGWYTTAAIGDEGLHLYLQLIGMGTVIADADKTYRALPPEPFAQTPTETATLFGGRGTTVYGPGGTSYQFQNGQVKTPLMPAATLQLTVGNLFGTQAVVRYVPIPEIDNFPKTTLFGIGVRHSISRYLPSLPVELAAGALYQRLTIGDIMEARGLAAGVQVSKGFTLLTLYGGLQYETSTLTLSYTNEATSTAVHTDIDGENHLRVTAGLLLDFGVLGLHADAGIGKVAVVSGGLRFGR